MIDKPEVLEALKKVHEPKLKKDLVELGMIRNLMIDEGNVKLTLALTTLDAVHYDLFAGFRNSTHLLRHCHENRKKEL